MKKGKKEIARKVLSLFGVIAILFLFVQYNQSYNRITRYVNRNHERLTEYCQKYDSGMQENMKEDGIEVFGHYGNAVMFHYNGYGMGSQTKYCGFYYTPDDKPASSFMDVSYQLADDGHGGWNWMSQDDNEGMTKKIRDNWYYYEAWF